MIAALTVLLYGVFLWRQLGAQATDFQEPSSAVGQQSPRADSAPTPLRETLSAHRAELLLRSALLVATVLVIGLLTESPVVLADSPTNLLLLGATLAVSAISASAPRVTVVHGAVHLLLFGVYSLMLFS